MARRTLAPTIAVAMAILATVLAPGPPSAAASTARAPGWVKQDLQQDFTNAVNYCTNSLEQSVQDKDQSDAREALQNYLIKRYVKGADQQNVMKDSIKIYDEGNGALKMAMQVAGTNGADTGQMVNTEFSVGSYIMDLLSSYGKPPWNLPAEVTKWALPCLQAAFILDGQAGSELGQSMRSQVYPPASTMPASELPQDMGPIDLPH